MSDGFTLRPIATADSKQVKNHIREYFFENEPIHRYLFKRDCPDFRYFEKTKSIHHSIEEGLSYLIITKSGDIAAVGIVGHKVTEPSRKFATPIQLKLEPLFNMVNGEALNLLHLSETDKLACLRILSVHPNWYCKGLAKLIIEKVISSLKERGFTHVNSFCTGAFSTSLFEKFGFQKMYSIKYSEYTENGQSVVLPDPPHTHLSYMLLKL